MTSVGTSQAAGSDRDYIVSLVRTHDRARYYSALFGPADKRPHLFALYAMNAEIGRIPESASEPGLGEIRFQWWQDSIRSGGTGETPVMGALKEAIAECSLPADALSRLVGGHRDDLYGDPWATLQDMEGYFGVTESALFQLASLVLGSDGRQTADAAGHAGIAYGLSLHLAAMFALRRGGRQIAPPDLLEIYGMDAAAMFADSPPPGFDALLGHLVDLAGQHYQDARKAIRSIPAACRPAFLALALVPVFLKRVQRQGKDLWYRPVMLSDLTKLSRIGRAALFGL